MGRNFTAWLALSLSLSLSPPLSRWATLRKLGMRRRVLRENIQYGSFSLCLFRYSTRRSLRNEAPHQQDLPGARCTGISRHQNKVEKGHVREP